MSGQEPTFKILAQTRKSIKGPINVFLDLLLFCKNRCYKPNKIKLLGLEVHSKRVGAFFTGKYLRLFKIRKMDKYMYIADPDQTDVQEQPQALNKVYAICRYSVTHVKKFHMSLLID